MGETISNIFQILGPEDNLKTVYAPFSFPMKNGKGEEIRNAPISYVPHLWEKIDEMISANSDNERG